MSRSPQLSDFDNHSSVVYAVDRAFRLTYHNGAWDQFALENDALDVAGEAYMGRSVLDITADALKPFYTAAFNKVFAEGTLFEHRYECSSPESIRTFLMCILAVSDESIAVVNSKVHERPAAGEEPEPSRYAGAGGIVTMCSHCRRTLRAGTASFWDWVPAYVSHPPQRCSHGLCETCLLYHYGIS